MDFQTLINNIYGVRDAAVAVVESQQLVDAASGTPAVTAPVPVVTVQSAWDKYAVPIAIGAAGALLAAVLLKGKA